MSLEPASETIITLLPPFLEIPFTVAAGAEFVGRHLSARDISYAMAVAWLAARTKPEEGTDDHFRIPDNRLRASLGRNRRNSIDVETDRFFRMRDAVIRLDNDLPMPTVMFRNDIPVRSNLDDELTWVVSPALVDLFRPGEAAVMLPTALLANARHSSTVELVMRLLAAHVRGPDGGNVVAWSMDRIGLRMSFEELTTRFHIPADTQPGVVIKRYLEPAASDAFNAAGISIEIEARRTYTHRNPKGKLRDVLIYMVMSAPSALEAKIMEAQPSSWTKRPSTGKRKGRPARAPVMAVADTGNVVALRPAMPKHGFRPVDKKLGIGSIDPQDDDDSLRF